MAGAIFFGGFTVTLMESAVGWVQVAATAKGRAALEAGRARRVDRLAVVLEHLGAPERTAVAEAVELLEEALEAAPPS